MEKIYVNWSVRNGRVRIQTQFYCKALFVSPRLPMIKPQIGWIMGFQYYTELTFSW